MTHETDGLEYIVMWDKRGGNVRLTTHARGSIDAAVTQWIDSGLTKDALLSLTTTGGSEFKIPASEISNWIYSTPEARRNDTLLDATLLEEKKHFRAEAGIFEED